VPLDTIRDYLFVADCARLVADGLSRLERERTIAGSLVVTKILASQRPITVGAVLGEMRRIFKGSARYVVAASGLSSVQTRDLSFRSRVWPELDRRTLTPLPVGVARTAADLLSRATTGRTRQRCALRDRSPIQWWSGVCARASEYTDTK
jgi:UDP-glucose 4-epimerase